jgi:hypothetical protein
MFRTAGDVYRGFSRFAAVAFFLVAIYTLLVKVAGGDIRDDWSHTVLHVATGLFAVYAGWIAAGETAAVAFAWALALGYGGLGVVGWFIHGLLMNTTLRVPLGAADNVFHLFLGAGAIVAIAVAWAWTERPRADRTRGFVGEPSNGGIALLDDHIDDLDPVSVPKPKATTDRD